jgi:hypothetical protein
MLFKKKLQRQLVQLAKVSHIQKSRIPILFKKNKLNKSFHLLLIIYYKKKNPTHEARHWKRIPESQPT